MRSRGSRKSRRGTRPTAERDVPARKPKGQNEAIPDLWEVPGTKLPGNPKITAHEPEYTYVLDVRGDRVCVVKSKVTRFRASAAGIENLHKVRRPQKVFGLWTGARHHCLTHALRLFQVNSVTFEGQHKRGHERQLRGSIHPRQLLEACGASRALASTLVEQLLSLQLLRCHENKNGASWFINTRIRGFGPNIQQYTSSDLGDEAILPEFVTIAKTPKTEPTLPGKEVGEKMRQPAPGKKRIMRTDQEHLQTLQTAMAYIRSFASGEGGLKDKDGYIVFGFRGSMKELLSHELGCSPVQAGKILAELKLLGLTEGLPQTGLSQGFSRRRVKFAGAIAPADVRRVREHYASKQRGFQAAKAGTPLAERDSSQTESHAETSEGKGVITDMDSFMAMVRRRFADYEERIETLNSMLAERRATIVSLQAELDSRPATAEIVIPDDLAKYLN